MIRSMGTAASHFSILPLISFNGGISSRKFHRFASWADDCASAPSLTRSAASAASNSSVSFSLTSCRPEKRTSAYQSARVSTGRCSVSYFASAFCKVKSG